MSLGLDKHEWLGWGLVSFLACIDESISEREGRQFKEGLWIEELEFRRYLGGVGDAGTGLLFKFRSGIQGLNEELSGHRGREGKSECALCGA